jgi:hypothetical protein
MFCMQLDGMKSQRFFAVARGSNRTLESVIVRKTAPRPLVPAAGSRACADSIDA